MNLPRIVLDNSAALPAFFPEADQPYFDSGLVTNRAKALINAVRTRRVKAYVPPSFYREFLNVATQPLFRPGGRNPALTERIRAQWDDLLSIRLIVISTKEIIHHSGILTFEDGCPAADAWYLAAAIHAKAEFWISHEHSDGLAAIASKHVTVRLLSKDAVNF